MGFLGVTCGGGFRVAIGRNGVESDGRHDRRGLESKVHKGPQHRRGLHSTVLGSRHCIPSTSHLLLGKLSA